jgi:hypothetical protein
VLVQVCVFSYIPDTHLPCPNTHSRITHDQLRTKYSTSPTAHLKLTSSQDTMNWSENIIPIPPMHNISLLQNVTPDFNP